MVNVSVSLIKIKRELKIFPSRINGGRPSELNENEVMELLEDLSNILGDFLIKQLFHSRLLDMR